MEQQKNKKIQNKTDWISIRAYTSYIFQTFLKRPFGYIISILYLFYLCIILIIVPVIKNLDPLYIWNTAGFNMPIFNLLFVSLASASIAVCVFRTGREDGSDLLLSSKPLTKTANVCVKTFVFITIVCILTLLSVFIALLVKPIFGEFNLLTNPTGITNQKYQGLVLSVLIGNLINLFFFGGCAILISLFGNQIITILITFAIAFIMCLINFLGPLTVRSVNEVIKEKTNSSIMSFSCPTLNQYNSSNDEFKNYATIESYCDSNGNPYIFDTNKFWTESKKDAHYETLNYIDFGKQLSMTYSSYGLDDTKLQEASKMSIGSNLSYRYEINQDTCVAQQFNTGEYPLALYTITEDRGKIIPVANIIGGKMNASTNNWYVKSKLLGISSNTVIFITPDSTESSPKFLPNWINELFDNKTWFTLSELSTTPEQAKYFLDDTEDSLYSKILTRYAQDLKTHPFYISVLRVLQDDESGIFYQPKSFDDLTPFEQFLITSKIEILLYIKLQQRQLASIQNFTKSEKPSTIPDSLWEKVKTDKYPYSSSTVKLWYDYNTQSPLSSFYLEQKIIKELLSTGLLVYKTQRVADLYVKPICTQINYIETYGNLYQYNVYDFYSIWTIIGVWSSISVILFASSIVVYRKIDLK